MLMYLEEACGDIERCLVALDVAHVTIRLEFELTKGQYRCAKKVNGTSVSAIVRNELIAQTS